MERGRPRGPRVTVNCEVCGNPFDVTPGQVGKRLSCSEVCKSRLRSMRAARSKGETVTNLALLNEVTLFCEVCGNAFPVRRCYKDRLKTCEGCRRKTASLRAAKRLAATKAAYGADLPDRTPSTVVTSQRLIQECVVCKGQYLISPTEAHGYTTCSRDCSSRRRSAQAVFGWLQRVCTVCRESFQVKETQVRGGRPALHCSNRCRLIALNSLPREPPKTAPCRTCGKPFHCPDNFKRPDADGKTRGVYCSRACMWLDDDYRKRRAVRHSPSNLERWLFAVLDADGVKYRKYATVGRYVPDALLPDYKVIIEVDGVVWHRKRVDYDRQRDADFAAAGYTVMHFSSLEITSGKKTHELIGAALEDIKVGRAQYRPILLWRARRELRNSPDLRERRPPEQAIPHDFVIVTPRS